MERVSTFGKLSASTAWMLGSLVLTLWYVWLFWEQAFAGDLVIQDDARQHVFWAYRYFAPGYLQNDTIADYFETLAPFGYHALYRTVASLGIDPLLFNKLLPGALGLATTYYCFRLSLRVLPSPAVAFVATLLLNHMVWGHDDLPSGTPRAFVYPLLLASFNYIAARAFRPLLITLVLEAAFYPHALLITLATYMLGLFAWEGGRLRIAMVPRDYGAVFLLVGLSISLLLPYLVKSGEFGPLVTAAEARHLPEFHDGGRSAFFEDNWWGFWVKGRRSGLWPTGMGMVAAVCLVLAASVPWISRRKASFRLLERLTPAVSLLLRVAIASSVLFAVAHLLLFRLHLPSRFTQHSFRIIVAVGGAVALVAIGEALWRKMTSAGRVTVVARAGCGLLVLGFAALVLYSQIRWAMGKEVVKANFKVGENASLYRFLQTQPRDSVVAVLSRDADFIPSLARRSVVYAGEYAIAYQRGYFLSLKARRKAMVAAFKTDDPDRLKNFIDTYGVTHFLVDDKARRLWRKARKAQVEPVLRRDMARCAVFGNRTLVVDAACVLQSEGPPEG